MARTCLIENFERLKAQELKTVAEDKFGSSEILKNAHETIGGRSNYLSYTYVANGFGVMQSYITNGFGIMHSYTLACCPSLCSPCPI